MIGPKTLPLVIAFAMAVASVPYWATGDWRHGTYWLAAAVINTVVTI